MNNPVRNLFIAASLAACAVPFPAFAQQSDPHQHDQAGEAAKPAPGQGGMGMGGMMGGGMMGEHQMMMQMMQNCRQMMQGGGAMGARGLPRLPAGNEKMELQMHADMMKAMGDIMAKYAARLPDKK